MNNEPALLTQQHSQPRQLGFVTCATDAAVLARRLLASPCIASGETMLDVHVGATSAAQAFNAALARRPQPEWLVWVHQDVYLPPGWDTRFVSAIRAAELHFSRLAVVGLYGIAGAGAQALRAGHVLDRGHLLREPSPLPCRVDSLDELLFAVRSDTGLTLDPDLGFDFYATDLALTAFGRGLDVAVVDACCEHWSETPRTNVPRQVVDRVSASGALFERKWAHQLPLDTPCFSIRRLGDVATQCRALGAAAGPEAR